MSYNTELKINKNGWMETICPHCGAELNVDWRDWFDTINDTKIYHIFCERCDCEIYSSINIK